MNWQSIADSLRQELAEYGALLHLFEQQQESLFKRDPDNVLRLGTEIEDQAHILQDCRGRREQAVAGFATLLGLPASSTIRSLLPHVEADARPLLEALINEINVLLHRVRRTSRHNHTLLSRTLELHQETLRQLRPDAFTKTYSPSGRVSLAATAGAPSLRAAG
ncbi:MAG TPA: flagellar protein FlgN [Opitutus sp.]|nr:flagellar protein FlgN [Opitutus sp.]